MTIHEYGADREKVIVLIHPSVVMWDYFENVRDMNLTKAQLSLKYSRVEEDNEKSIIRVYDPVTPEEIVSYLYKNGITVSEITTDKVSLEEYYMDLMSRREGRYHG